MIESTDESVNQDEILAKILQEEEDKLWLEQNAQSLASDQELAKLLQEEEHKTLAAATSSTSLDDPTPDLHDCFLSFNELYFGNQLDMVEVKWSSRMTLCAGLCVYRNDGHCEIKLSEPLLKYRTRQDMIDTLLHEMIHALLFVTRRFDNHEHHGPEFLKEAERINKLAGSNITVYHNFHDEVDHYRTHVWQCNGPCQDRPPYFGIVKRSMNRPPQPADTWFAEHQQTCGGTYTKIAEPPGKTKRKATRDIASFFENPKKPKT